tara:strand:- start:6 stop:191 length:186 start_codon:yes stop_codon:yes gene_type:complete
MIDLELFLNRKKKKKKKKKEVKWLREKLGEMARPTIGRRRKREVSALCSWRLSLYLSSLWP